MTIESNANNNVIKGSDGTQCGGRGNYNGPIAEQPALPNHGSCFGMQLDATTVSYTAIRGFNGIVIGSTQTASGVHGGLPDGSESPGIDQPWLFYGGTGMHFATIPFTEIVPNSVLDFGGWHVTWNNILSIDMGKLAHNGYTDGQAQITCIPANCPYGATYTLGYTATVPSTSPSFPRVKYSLRLEGHVIEAPPPTSLPLGIAPGGIGGATKTRVNATNLQTGGVPADNTEINSLGGLGYASSGGGYFDFVTPTATAGGTTQVVLPQTAALPSGFVYRKYKAAGGWSTFVATGGDMISSAPGALGIQCPAPGNVAYGPATAGHYCLRLTIRDGGPNDADGSLNSSVKDPGGVATPNPKVDPPVTPGTSGCSLSAHPVNPLERGDWWLLLGFVAWMGFVVRRKRASMK